MSCILCHCILSDDLKIIYHNKSYCQECHESLLFAEDIDDKEVKIEKKEEKKDKVIFYQCLRCKLSYQGTKCSCGFMNPLFMRKIKKR
jgi:thymidylate kinase